MEEVTVVFLRDHEVKTEDGKTRRFKAGGKGYKLREDAARHHIRRQHAMLRADYMEWKATRAAEEVSQDENPNAGDDNGANATGGDAGGGQETAQS